MVLRPRFNSFGRVSNLCFFFLVQDTFLDTFFYFYFFYAFFLTRADTVPATGSRGSPAVVDHRRVFASRPGSLIDVGSATGDSGGVSSASGGGRMPGSIPIAMPRDAGNATAGGAGAGASTRPTRRGSGTAGILSEFALSALSANGGTERVGGGSGALGGGGGAAAAAAAAAGGRAAVFPPPPPGPSAPFHHHQQQHGQYQQFQQHCLGSPQPLSPALRGGAPPGSVLSSFASPGTASWRWVGFPRCFWRGRDG